jgi:N-acetylmuramoyl-L-alanine amidase
MTYWGRVGSAALVAVSILPLDGALRTAAGETPGVAATKSKHPQCNPTPFQIVVDVGHTAEKVGARSARGVGEYEFNLRLSKVIEQHLVEAGGSARASLVERVDRANRLGADLFLSVHHDSVPNSFLLKWDYEGEQRGYSDRFKGHSLFVSIDNGDYKGSLQFGHLLGNQLKERGLAYTPHYTEKFMGSRRRLLVDPEAGVYRYDQLIVLKDTRMPAVLLEAGSIINREEELLVATPEHQARISAAVADSVNAFCTARAERSRPVVAKQQPTAARP